MESVALGNFLEFHFVKGVEDRGNIDLSVMNEPKGISRVLQLLFGLLAGLAMYMYEGVLSIDYCTTQSVKLAYSYPFKLEDISEKISCKNKTMVIKLAVDDSFSQYSEYFVFVCLLSIVYSLVLFIIYIKYTSAYDQNKNCSLVDFVGTVVVSFLWLFAAAAWTHGLSELKTITTSKYYRKYLLDLDKSQDFSFGKVTSSGHFGLNVSAILGCLSFFIWATDLWFLYKETPWFQGRRAQTVGSPA